jgi:hypothetical protein
MTYRHLMPGIMYEIAGKQICVPPGLEQMTLLTLIMHERYSVADEDWTNIISTMSHDPHDCLSKNWIENVVSPPWADGVPIQIQDLQMLGHATVPVGPESAPTAP